VAKAKSAKSKNLQPALTATPKKVASKAAKASKAQPEGGADKSPAFTGIAIGHAAGDVWGLLSNDGPKTIAEVKKALSAPADVVVAAIGWLAREDKIEFDTSGKTVKIGLR
jgi:hypothetical protein